MPVRFLLLVLHFLQRLSTYNTDGEVAQLVKMIPPQLREEREREKKNHLFCTSQGLKLFICKSVHRDGETVRVCLLTGKWEAVLITTNPSHPADSVRRASLTAPPMISLISCLLSPPVISLLFIYHRFVQTHRPGSTFFEGVHRKAHQAEDIFFFLSISFVFNHLRKTQIYYGTGFLYFIYFLIKDGKA